MGLRWFEDWGLGLKKQRGQAEELVRLCAENDKSTNVRHIPTNFRHILADVRH